ncbi:MAG: IclR family transcriptional regulator [Opitutales bacterium]
MSANRTLGNGLRLLEAMATQPGPFGVRTLAQTLAVPDSHAHRLLQTLVEAGYVEQTVGRKYRLTFRIFSLTAALADAHPYRRAGAPILRRLAEETGGGAVLTVWDSGQPLVILADSPGARKRRGGPDIGTRFHPLHSASGRAFLAWRADAGHTLPAEEKTAIRASGVAWKPASGVDPIRALAAPVHLSDAAPCDLVVGLSFPGEIWLQVADKQEGIARLVGSAAEELALQLAAREDFVAQPVDV